MLIRYRFRSPPLDSSDSARTASVPPPQSDRSDLRSDLGIVRVPILEIRPSYFLSQGLNSAELSRD
eukprot:1404922-Alexandrium_andersonii.AAC.1